MTERLRPSERRALRYAEEERLARNSKRRRAYWLKFVAGRPARCHECGETKTANDMIEYARREVSKKNRCHPCFEKDLDTDAYEPEFAGDRIYWKLNP